MASLTLTRLLIHQPNKFSALCSIKQFNQMRTMSSDSQDEVIFERKDDKGIITLNRPKQLNALNLSMAKLLYSQLRKWETDNTLRMVIIKGNGDKAFCAGGDVKAIALEGKNSKLSKEFFREEYRLNNQIGSLSVPYISFLNGIVMGGGVGLSVHGVYRVATEKSVFAMPETAIGLFPDVGSSWLLPRLPGKLGLYLGLTGHRLEGRDLYKAGIATHFVCSAKLEELENDLLRLKNADLKKIDALLTRFQEQWEQDFKKEFSLKPYIGRINSVFGAESVEKIIETLKNDQSEWAKKTLEVLTKVSPTSLKVAYSQYHKGINMSLPDCLKMEYRIVQNFMNNHDFFEGIRALLIDKDNNPKWKPSTLSEVTEQLVESYFEAPANKDFKELQL